MSLSLSRACRAMFVILFLALVAACSPASFTERFTWEDASEGPALSITGEEIVEIEYWQYNAGVAVTAMDILIEQFHEQYPNIRVIHNYETTFDDYPEVIAARVPAGVGPDVVTLYFSWQSAWIDAGYLVPLPQAYFSHPLVRREFSPIVEAGFMEGELYALPTAVRVAALFYNKDLMEEAGLNPDTPPTTLEELEHQALQCTQRNEDGSFEIMGLPVAVDGQAEPWFREVLLRQFGQEPYSDDRRTVQWNASPGGYAAWEQLLRFQQELETGDAVLFDSDPNYFVTGRACFLIDTSARVEILAANAPDLQFGVVELPEHNEIRSTFGSYWAHGLTPKGASSPERMNAAVTFLQFITRPEAGRLWVDIVGELPAQNAAVQDTALLNDPMLEPFLTGLAYAHAPFIIDEDTERAALVDAYDAVVTGDDPAGQLNAAVDAVQAIFDQYWAGR